MQETAGLVAGRCAVVWMAGEAAATCNLVTAAMDETHGAAVNENTRVGVGVAVGVTVTVVLSVSVSVSMSVSVETGGVAQSGAEIAVAGAEVGAGAGTGRTPVMTAGVSTLRTDDEIAAHPT